MAEITARQVAALRTKTDAPMMACKQALLEAQGDPVRAEELLRVKLGNKAVAAAARVTAEGIVVAHLADKTGALVELNCETDFVARHEDFIAFANTVAQLVTVHRPANIAALLMLPLDNATVNEVRIALIGKIGENLTIRRFVCHETAHRLACYLHGSRIGVLVEYEGADEQVGKDVAMHIAAMKPVALSAEEVSSAVIEKERAIAQQKAVATGKPADIIAKIVAGSVQKYLQDITLLDQPFVKNDKQTVAQMLAAAKAKVQRFTCYVAGEGIEKRSDDFAAEVAAQIAGASA
jgi:elongation factor Ts